MQPLTYIPFDQLKENSDYLNFIAILRRKWKFPYLDIDWSREPNSSFIAWILRPDRRSHRYFHWILLDRDQPVGWMYFFKNKIEDKQILTAQLILLDQYHNKGHGKYSITYGIKSLNEQNLLNGISRFHLDLNDKITSSSIYDKLQTIGFEVNYTSRVSGVDLSSYNWDKISEKSEFLASLAQSLGYSFDYITNGDLDQIKCKHEDFFKMRELIWNDMPSEEANWEKVTYDQGMHDEHYESVKDGDKAVMLLCYNKDKLPVALTEVWFNGDIPYFLHQDDTGVIPTHRGKKLGVTLKTMMINHIYRTFPQRAKKLKYWITGNAGSNIHMLRINEELGYKELFHIHCHEINIEKALEYFKVQL